MIYPDVTTSGLSTTSEIVGKQTVGSAAVDLLKKGDQRQGVIDTQREMMKNYVDELIKCAQSGANALGKDNTFYVCVQTRRERLLPNVIRNQFYYRQTRPAPTYDLALYHYEPKEEQLRFVWCIPDKDTVADMATLTFVPEKGEEQLYWFVKCFLAGTLV